MNGPRFLIFVAAAATLAGAEAPSIGWQALLGSAQRDPVVLSGTRQLALASSTELPLLWKDLGARWESKRGDLLVQQANLRLEPLAWGERGANLSLRANRESQSAMRLENARTKALLERYRLGISWLYQNRQLQYHRLLVQLHDDRAKVQARLVGDPRFDPQDLVNSLQEKVEKEGEVLGDQNDISELEASLRSLSGLEGRIELDGNLLPLAKIQSVLATLPVVVDTSFPARRLESVRLQLAESKYALQAAKSRSIVSYLETGWEWDRTVQSKTDALNRAPWQNLSFGAGIRIPLFNGEAGELSRSRGDLEATRGDFLETHRDLSLRYAALKAEIGSMIRRKATLDSFATRMNAGNLFADYAKRADSDPLLVLKARASVLENSWKSEKLRYEITLRFADILALTGHLGSRPEDNVLLDPQP